MTATPEEPLLIADDHNTIELETSWGKVDADADLYLIDGSDGTHVVKPAEHGYVIHHPNGTFCRMAPDSVLGDWERCVDSFRLPDGCRWARQPRDDRRGW